MTNQKKIQKIFPKKSLEVSRHINSAGVGAEKRQCAGVDNNHTEMLSAVTA